MSHPESSAAAAARASSSSSSSAPPPLPLALPHPPQRILLPRVQRLGMAASSAASYRPVRLLERPGEFEVRVQVPCNLEALISVTTGRIPGNRGMFIQGRVNWSRMREGGAFVYRPGSRRLHSGGEFEMRFSVPKRVRRPLLRRLSRDESFIIYRLQKVPPNDPDEPDDQVSDHRTITFSEEFE